MRKLTLLAPLAVAALALSACSSAAAGSSSTASSGATSASGTAAATSCGTTVPQIAAAAKKEGAVNLIALPDTWANYGGILDSFRKTYGINATVANPDASSADEITAIKTLRGQASQPELVDVGASFTQQMIDDGYAQTYKPTVWDEIPANLKDADGHWVAAYYGVMSIGVNTKLVKNAPKTFADLKDPQYKGQIGLNGDPREAGAAFAAVMAASLANGGSFDDIKPGIQYFSDLKKSGNLTLTKVNKANLLSGEVPIALDWTYNFPALKPLMQQAGFDLQVTVPQDGVYGGYYAQSVVTQSAHPCAAELFLEHLVGNDGALGYLKGGAIPARYASLVKAGLVDSATAANLPDPATIAKIAFPTQKQLDAAKAVLAAQWGPMVADK